MIQAIVMTARGSRGEQLRTVHTNPNERRRTGSLRGLSCATETADKCLNASRTSSAPSHDPPDHRRAEAPIAPAVGFR